MNVMNRRRCLSALTAFKRSTEDVIHNGRDSDHNDRPITMTIDNRCILKIPLKQKKHNYFRPGNGSPSATNVVVVLILGVVVSAKALSFHNRSSSNFAYTSVTN